MIGGMKRQSLGRNPTYPNHLPGNRLAAGAERVSVWFQLLSKFAWDLSVRLGGSEESGFWGVQICSGGPPVTRHSTTTFRSASLELFDAELLERVDEQTAVCLRNSNVYRASGQRHLSALKTCRLDRQVPPHPVRQRMSVCRAPTASA